MLYDYLETKPDVLPPSIYANIDDKPFEERTGWEVHHYASHTGLNKYPAATLVPRIVGSASELDLLWNISDVAKLIVIQGSVADYDGQLLTNLIDATVHGRIVQKLNSKFVRVFALQPGGSWLISDYENYGGSRQKLAPATDELDNPLEVPGSAVMQYANGRGLLADTQRLFFRMEQAAITMSGQMSGAALALVATNYQGDFDDLNRAAASGKKVLGVPGRGAQLTRVGTTEVINHLQGEYLMLRDEYLRLTHCIDITKGANTSGEAWSVRLEEMRYYVQDAQTHIRNIFKLKGQEVQFDNYQVTTARTRTEEFALLVQLRDAQIIDEAAFRERAEALVP